MDNFEHVYVITNPNHNGWCKVGYTTKSVEERRRELSSATGVLGKFEIRYVYNVSVGSGKVAEEIAHRSLVQNGIEKQKEFFRCSAEHANQILSNVLSYLQSSNTNVDEVRNEISRLWRKIHNEYEENIRTIEAEKSKEIAKINDEQSKKISEINSETQYNEPTAIEAFRTLLWWGSPIAAIISGLFGLGEKGTPSLILFIGWGLAFYSYFVDDERKKKNQERDSRIKVFDAEAQNEIKKIDRQYEPRIAAERAQINICRQEIKSLEDKLNNCGVSNSSIYKTSKNYRRYKHRY